MRGIGRGNGRGNGKGNGRGRGYGRRFGRHAGMGYSIRNVRGQSYLIEQQEHIEENKEQHKEENLANRIYEILPKLNCRACGYNSCMDCANAIANGEERYDACRVLKPQQKEKIRKIIEGDNHV